MKRFIFTVFILFALISCENKKHKEVKKTFEENLLSKIDSFYCDTGNNRLFLIRHQKFNKKDFVQIKINYDYNLDSLAYCIERNGKLVVFYNNDFFLKKIKINNRIKDSLLQEYNLYSNKYSEGVLYNNICQEVYEVKNDRLIKVNNKLEFSSKLFNYNSSFIPPPPPSKK